MDGISPQVAVFLASLPRPPSGGYQGQPTTNADSVFAYTHASPSQLANILTDQRVAEFDRANKRVA